MIQLIGWLGILGASLLIGSGVLSLIAMQVFMGIAIIALGIVFFFWSSAVKKYVKWTWYFGIIFYILGILYGVYSLLTAFGLASFVSLAYSSLVVFVLVKEREKFFNSSTMQSTNSLHTEILTTPVANKNLGNNFSIPSTIPASPAVNNINDIGNNTPQSTVSPTLPNLQNQEMPPKQSHPEQQFPESK